MEEHGDMLTTLCEEVDFSGEPVPGWVFSIYLGRVEYQLNLLHIGINLIITTERSDKRDHFPQMFSPRF
jgi:hypothetical protein